MFRSWIDLRANVKSKLKESVDQECLVAMNQTIKRVSNSIIGCMTKGEMNNIPKAVYGKQRYIMSKTHWVVRPSLLTQNVKSLYEVEKVLCFHTLHKLN